VSETHPLVPPPVATRKVPAPQHVPRPAHPGFSGERVAAMVLRYVYLLRASWTRLLEIIYWPTMEMIMWGLISRYMMTASTILAQAAGLFLAAVLLWQVLFRSQMGVHTMFQEEMYARNLGHLFISPLRPYEMVVALLAVSLLRTSISAGAAALLAIPLYHFSIFSMGLPLIAFFANLMIFGWAFGLVLCGLLLRFGFGAEGLAWAGIFVLTPFSGVYYPISTLPAWLQPVAHAIPSSYVFEGMRAVLLKGEFRTDLFFSALALNGIYISIGVGVFLFTFGVARRRGLLLQVGE
jgi:ABC-2 type transport system permease protein